MKDRVIGGTLVFIITAALIAIGGIGLKIACMAAGCIGAFEIFKAAGIQNNRVTWIIYPAIIVFGLFCKDNISLCIVIAVTMIYLIVVSLSYPRFKYSFTRIWLLGFFYTGIMFFTIFLIRNRDDGLFYSSLALFTAWGCDVFAFFTGSKFGKHHPFPLLSPKKSTEGCIGGILGGFVIGLLLALVFNQNIGTTVLVSGVCAVFSELGDLAASSIKRQFGIKDYGNLIRGHGGLMDRFDSFLFTGSIVYLCIRLLGF